MLYVQTWTPDDGRKDHPKHVEWYSINSKNCASTWFYYRNRKKKAVYSYRVLFVNDNVWDVLLNLNPMLQENPMVISDEKRQIGLFKVLNACD
jgi:hypothetical protein